MCRFEESLQEYKEAISRQANAMEDGWFDLIVQNGNGAVTYTIPKAPFEHWALRGKAPHLATPWEVVCPPGLKMNEDSPFHSDFIIGGGIPLDQVYGVTPVNVALLEAAQDLLHEKLRFKCVVLSGHGSVGGFVVHPMPDERVESGSIIVIPHGDAKYFIPMVTACKAGAGAVIMETGGSLAHLVVNGIPHNFRIVREKDAKKLYPEGSYLLVNCDTGIIIMSDNPKIYRRR